MIFKKKIVITKTPLRISFSGGGTDMPYFYKKNKGTTVSSSINKFIYITLKSHKNFNEKFRLNYSQTEIVNDIDKIKNLRIKETLKYFNVKQGLYINTISDLPYNTGLGSSSAFLVGLIRGLLEMYGISVTRKKISEIAFYIENKITKDSLGKQDHYIASYGGLKKIDYFRNKITVNNIFLNSKNKNFFKKNLLFLWTGTSRLSKNNLIDQKKNFIKNYSNLKLLNKLTENFYKLIKEKKINLRKIAQIMNDGWNLKRDFAKNISNNFLEKIYKTAIKKGCWGGKLLGAGGGGFFLFICPKNKQKKIISTLKMCDVISFEFTNEGSEIIYSS